MSIWQVRLHRIENSGICAPGWTSHIREFCDLFGTSFVRYLNMYKLNCIYNSCNMFYLHFLGHRPLLYLFKNSSPHQVSKISTVSRIQQHCMLQSCTRSAIGNQQLLMSASCRDKQIIVPLFLSSASSLLPSPACAIEFCTSVVEDLSEDLPH